MFTRNSIILFFLLLLLNVPWLGLRDFYSRGEPREALVAQSMLMHGEWILGQGYGGSVPSKPPLTHWLTALFSLPQGEVSEFSARLPSALSSLFFVLCFFLFLRSRYSDAHAAFSLLILSASAEWFRAGSTCRVDMTLAALLASALLVLFSHAERPTLLKGLGASLLIALAGLTKGPVAFVLPLVVYFAFALTQKKRLSGVIVTCAALSIIPVLVLVSWYGLAYLQKGEAFFYKIYQENIARFTSSMDEDAHQHGFIYLVGALALGFCPWTLALLPVELRRIKRPALSECFAKWKEAHSFSRYSLLVCLIVFAFYCVPSSKRGVYLLPLYPFLSHLVALRVLSWSKLESKFGQLAFVGVAALFLALLTGSLGVWSGMLEFEKLQPLFRSADAQLFLDSLAHFPEHLSTFAWMLLLVVSALATAILLGAGRIINWSWYATFLYSLYLFLNVAILPFITNQLSGRIFAAQIVGKLEPSKTVYSYGYEFYALSFYTQRIILRWNGEGKSGDLALLFEDELARLESELAGMYQLRRLFTSAPGLEKPGKRALLVSIE